MVTIWNSKSEMVDKNIIYVMHDNYKKKCDLSVYYLLIQIFKRLNRVLMVHPLVKMLQDSAKYSKLFPGT